MIRKSIRITGDDMRTCMVYVPLDVEDVYEIVGRVDKSTPDYSLVMKNAGFIDFGFDEVEPVNIYKLSGDRYAFGMELYTDVRLSVKEFDIKYLSIIRSKLQKILIRRYHGVWDKHKNNVTLILIDKD